MLVLGSLILHFSIPGCNSLKEKRGIIKPLIHRVHKEFNLSVVELNQQDRWRETIIGCAAISNDKVVIEKTFQNVILYCQNQFPNLELMDHKIEIW